MNKAPKKRTFVSILIVLVALLYASSAFAQHADPRTRSHPNESAPSTTDEVGYGNSASAGASQIGRTLRTGVGFGAGTLTYGVSGKVYLTQSDAIQGVVGDYWGWGIAFGADYVRHVAQLFQAPGLGEFYAYVGGGGSAYLYDNVNSATLFGVSAIGGVAWHFGAIPVEITAEWRPTFLIGDYIGGFYPGGGGGAIRWYF